MNPKPRAHSPDNGLGQSQQQAWPRGTRYCPAQVAQVGSLHRRTQSQWEMTNALIATHTNHLNIEMARDSRTDSELMRRISFVTIVFLPATFIATFFSMGFFIVDDNGTALRVSRWIWLYFVCTMPLTALMGWQYAPASRFWSRWTKLG